MPELRKDPVVGRWVIIATDRAKRPSDFAPVQVDVPEPAKNPFAEGNEHMTPAEIFAFRDPKSKPNGPGWQVRVVPNKFPALRIEGDLDKEGQGMYDKMNGVGAHEVIIETPNPSLQLEHQPVEAIGRVIETYKIRVTDLLRDPRFRYILVFKNFGKQAGATIGHPHSQLIATPVTPKRLKEKLVGAMQYYAYKDRSIFEDILKQEVKEGSRLVYENAGFLAYCPYASRFPFEVTVMPRRQSAYFQDIHPDEILLLADALKVSLMKLSKALNQPQYNYLIQTAPARYTHHGYWSTIDQDFRWHIEILPRLTLIAGFEVGTGFYINPTPPEEAAKYLREIGVEPRGEDRAMPLHVAFLWHMHQPYYVDPVRGAALMPWVRLHATKGYLDMVWLADQCPEFHCTFNLTPVLLKQIQQLANDEVRDVWHELAEPSPETLTLAQKASVLEHFFKANWDNMIKPFPRYWTLLQKRGVNVAKIDLEHAAGTFTDQEFRDLQVWFNLTWFGYAAERLYPEIVELKRKGGEFTEADKHMVFDQQQHVLKNVLDYYKALAQRGQIEISTTPFFHPIMPLVYNTEFARRCMPGRDLPPPFSHPEDARAHLAMARDLHTQIFGVPPRGVWPSEGSVCPELIPLLQELGYEWFATDEENLWRSLAVVHPGKILDRGMLFQGWRAQYGDASACLAFRERTLSDFVGFTASRNDPHRAADFMVGQIEQIARTAHGADPFCAVILDGENAWEHFPDGGQGFLRELYQRLSTHPAVVTTTFHNYFSTHPPGAVLSTLHTGSWIQGDFDIWIGDPEENRGWELLGQTRDFLQAKTDRKEITPEQFKKAMQEIYAAEGSDWFWWYGGDFVTDNDLIFDELFRTHLQNVYRICGVLIPDVLKTAICRSEVAREVRKPTDLVTPIIDGLITSYYEWAGAGVYEAGRNMGAMYRTERCVEAVHFASDLTTFYLRVDFRKGVELPAKAVLRVNFVDPTHRALIVSNLRPDLKIAELWLTDSGVSYNNKKLTDVRLIKFDKILEVGIPLADLGWKQREQASFFVQLLEEDVEQERDPDIGTLNLTVPDDLFSAENWWV